MDIGHDEHGGHDLRDRDGHDKILENVVIRFQNRNGSRFGIWYCNQNLIAPPQQQCFSL